MKTAGNKVIHTQKFKFPEIQISKKTQKKPATMHHTGN